MKKAIILLALVVFSLWSLPTVHVSEPASAQEQPELYIGRIKQGGLGWNIGMDMVKDVAGTDVVRAVWNDVSNGFCMYPGEKTWRAANRGVNFPSDWRSYMSYGPVSMRIAPSNPDRVYMLYSRLYTYQGGKPSGNTDTAVFRSDDRCQTWTLTKFPFAGNNQCCAHGTTTSERMVVDPFNPNVIYVGHTTQGILRSLDGGETWTPVHDADTKTPIPASNLGSIFVASSGMAIWDGAKDTCPVVGGTCGRDVYVSSYTQGIWKSGDAGKTFHRIAGAPPILKMTGYANSGANRLVIVSITNYSDKFDVTKVEGSTLGEFTRICAVNGAAGWKISGFYALAPQQLKDETITATWEKGSIGSFPRMKVFSVANADLSRGAAAAFDGACAGAPSNGGAKSTANPDSLVFSVQVSNDPSSRPDDSWTCFATSPDCANGGRAGNNDWGVYKIQSGRGSVTITPKGTVNRGGFTAAIRQGASGKVSVENVANKGGYESIKAGPVNIIAGKLACDGTYFVTDTSNAQTMNANNYRVWRYDGKPLSWTQGPSSLSQLPIVRYVIPHDCGSSNPSGLWLSGVRIAGAGNAGQSMYQLKNKADWANASAYNGPYTTNGRGSRTTRADSGIFLTPPAGFPSGEWQSSIDGGDCKFNPITHELECSTGFSYYKAKIPYPTEFFEWTAMSAGIEAIVALGSHSVPGGHTWFAGQDVGWMLNLNSTDYPTNDGSGASPRAFPRTPIGGLCGSKGFDYQGRDVKNIWMYCNQAAGSVNLGWAKDGADSQKSYVQIGFPNVAAPNSVYLPPVFPNYPTPGGRSGGLAVNACDPNNLLLSHANTNAAYAVFPPIFQTKNARGAATALTVRWTGGATNTFTVTAIAGEQPEVGDHIWLVNSAGVSLQSFPVTITAISKTGAPATYTISKPYSFGGAANFTWYATNRSYRWTNLQNAMAAQVGVPTTGNAGWGHNAVYSGPSVIVSDKVQCDTFYAFNIATDDLLRTTDKGDTWSIVAADVGVTMGVKFGNDTQLVPHPTRPGELYLATGTYSGKTLRITNAHVGSKAAVSQCRAFGYSYGVAFGKGRNNGDPPNVWTLGSDATGRFRVIRSDDDCETVAFSTAQFQPADDWWPESAQTFGADMNVFGRFYVGLTRGAGSTCGQIIVPGGPKTC